MPSTKEVVKLLKTVINLTEQLSSTDIQLLSNSWSQLYWTWLAISQKKRFITKAAFRRSLSEVFPQKGARERLTGKHPCGSAIPTKLLSNFIKIIPPHGCSLANSLLSLRWTSHKKNSVGLILIIRITQQILSYAANFYMDRF